MSRHADVTFTWGDGEHTFRLAIGQIRELQEKVDAGPLEVLRRVIGGTWRIDDLCETIRLGLIGGGATPSEAIMLVRRYVDARPLIESVPVAAKILDAAISGAPDEELPKAEGEEETKASPSPTENSPSGTFMDGGQPSDTPPPNSTECLSGNSQPANAVL